MASTKSTPPAQQKPAENQKPNTAQPEELAKTQSGSPDTAPPAPSSDPAGEEAQRRAEEARIQQTPDDQREDEESKPQERSKKGVKAGDFLWYRGDYGPVFALVTADGEGGADVLLLRPDEVVRGRTVAVYDSPEDAQKGYGDGNPHVAWHPAK